MKKEIISGVNAVTKEISYYWIYSINKNKVGSKVNGPFLTEIEAKKSAGIK